MPAPLVEFPADDPERARTFWREVLGLELSERRSAAGSGWEVEADGLRLGVHERGKGPGDTASLPYLTVGGDEMAAVLERVVDRGGTVIHPGERWAICRDSEGSPFALAAETPEGLTRMERTRDGHPTFLALFLGTASDEGKAEMTAEESQAFMGAAKHGMVDGGTPLGPNTRVAASGASDSPNGIVTYAIVRAPSRDAAAEILAEHPHLDLDPGNSIEVMERLELPTGP